MSTVGPHRHQSLIPKKIMSNRQKSSNTDKYVHPSDRQISSITKQVISHITDLTNPTKEKKSNLQMMTKMSTHWPDKYFKLLNK